MCNISYVWIWGPPLTGSRQYQRIVWHQIRSKYVYIWFQSRSSSFPLHSWPGYSSDDAPLPCATLSPWHALNYTEYKQLTKWNLPHSGGRIQSGLEPFWPGHHQRRSKKSLLEIWTATISKSKNPSMSLNAELSKEETELLPLSVDLLIRS